MKCLKVDEYIKKTSSVQETKILSEELKKYVKSQPGLQGPTLCDRVIRACHHQLGVGSPDIDHITQLVKLVEISLHGYDMNVELVSHCSPLYMEKIIFHIVKKLSSLEVDTLCRHVASLLYNRLSAARQAHEDYSVLVQSCFSVLWSGLSTVKTLSPQDKLRCQMQAVSFLLLLDGDAAGSISSRVALYAKNAVTEFESSCAPISEEHAAFLFQETNTLFNKYFSVDQACQRDGMKQSLEASSFYPFSELALLIGKLLCKANHHSMAANFLNAAEDKIFDSVGSHCSPLVLGKWAVKIHSALKAGRECGAAFTECARILRSLSAEMDDKASHALLEGCSLVVWAVESGQKRGLSGPALLALFSFLEEHQEHLMKTLKKQTDNPKLQQAICLSYYQGFVFAHESLLATQLGNDDTLERVLLYCLATAGLLMTELQKLSNENFFVKAVIAVSNFACGLYNLRLYEQAFRLVEILCRNLCKNRPASLSADTLSRSFMLAVKTSRRSGKLEQALDWVILWLKALGGNIITHMAEPVSLWVKTKSDADPDSDNDIRLRTLRDGFGPDVPDEEVMLRLLAEELRCYKELTRDAAEERYNTLCDLLDICNEESSHKHLRAVYLCEMAQVVCFRDFSEQMDCMSVDFTNEALQLLEEVTETPENADILADDKAHALLWLYICSLEKKLQEAIENDKKRREVREQTPSVADPVGSNDFDYEAKQKSQDSNLVYEGLHFNLAAENKLTLPLEKALSLWSTLLKSRPRPSVRDAKQTCSSIAVAAALFRLLGKPLKALEAYQLAIGFLRELADGPNCARCLCQSASILLDVGSPKLALTQLEEAEKLASLDQTDEEPSALSALVVLLKAQYFYCVGKVDCGLPSLCEVLKCVNEQKQSKRWYMLRAQTLQVCSAYLDLDSTQLSKAQRESISQHGVKTPDDALYGSLKLLCSLLVTIVGNGLYGSSSSTNSDVRFISQGDNLVLKWQLLSELLTCSKKLVAMRCDCGAINDARLQCLEALKLANKLQAISQCTELLVMKADIELMQGEKEESRTDLQLVKNLLEHYTDVTNEVRKADVKIKPRKGRPVRKAQSAPPTAEDDLKDVLSSRWIAIEPIMIDPSSSPPLKTSPLLWLSSLAHEFSCQCPSCREPCLSRVTTCWAVTQADLIQKLEPSEIHLSSKLYRAALFQCKNITIRLHKKLAELFPMKDPDHNVWKPFLMQDVVSRVYLRMAQTALESRLDKVCSVWKTLDAGLTFVESATFPVSKSVRAGLMAAKAIASMVTLAAKKGCSPEELYSKVWTWNAAEIIKHVKPDENTCPLSSKPKTPFKTPDVSDQKKEARKNKILKPKVKGKSSSKEKSSVLQTPVRTKSKSCVGDLGLFSFNTIVPTLAFTPVNKTKTPKPTGKLQFHVYEDVSPGREKSQRVPAAPKRTKKTRFKVEFSDESDSEINPQEELKTKDPPKSQRSPRKAAPSSKATSRTPAERKPPQRQAKKTTALPCSSSDDDSFIGQPVSTRRGRTGRMKIEESETMRTITEESNEVLDMSVEQLRTSDAEAEEELISTKDGDTDLEVLRRDLGCSMTRDDVFEMRSRRHLTEDPQSNISHSDSRPDNLSLDDVEFLLRSAWLTLQHSPCPSIYPTLSSLLALTLGQQDPTTTAMLHAQSIGLTSRHRTVRHLSNSLHKLKKASNELADKMDSLSLNEGSRSVPAASIEHFSQMEEIFSFSIADPSSFPLNHRQEFMEQIQQIPEGVTVCLMSVIDIKPGEMGESILLSRLEKNSAPITVHISTSKQQRGISWLVREIDNILTEQKVASCVADKAKWWEGRWALDSRVECLLKQMERLLGCWKSLLLPISSDSELSVQAEQLCKDLFARGVIVSVEMLKAVLSAWPVLSVNDLKEFAQGLSPQWDDECDHLLYTSISKLPETDLQSHLVLILDKYLQKLPWESISVLKSHSVSRMPSFHSLLSLSLQKETDHRSILKHGVNLRKVFYVLDPDDNLKNAQERFKEWFSCQPDWQGVCGVAPELSQLQEAVSTKDLYIYVGHGAGARFLDSQSVLKQQMTAASLLFGCSSAALAVRGNQEGQGILLNYLIAGCPFILGNLWDVTDRDIDRFTKALLESWFSAGSGAPLLEHMGSSRRATHLKYLIGAAPVVYGLPIHLQ